MYVLISGEPRTKKKKIKKVICYFAYVIPTNRFMGSTLNQQMKKLMIFFLIFWIALTVLASCLLRMNVKL